MTRLRKHHKGIHYALYQRHGHHIAVGYVGNFVAYYGLDFPRVSCLAASRWKPPPAPSF